MARYEVHQYSRENTLVEPATSMVGLVQKEYILDEWMQDAVLALSVGDEQLSSKDDYFIRRVS